MEKNNKHKLPENGLLEGRDDDFGIFLEWRAKQKEAEKKSAKKPETAEKK